MENFNDAKKKLNEKNYAAKKFMVQKMKKTKKL